MISRAENGFWVTECRGPLRLIIAEGETREESRWNAEAMVDKQRDLIRLNERDGITQTHLGVTSPGGRCNHEINYRTGECKHCGFIAN